MRSRTGTQEITINMLTDIYINKGNQAIKLGLFIECNGRNIFLQKSYRKWGRETSSRPLLGFGKAIYEVKASG